MGQVIYIKVPSNIGYLPHEPILLFHPIFRKAIQLVYDLDLLLKMELKRGCTHKNKRVPKQNTKRR